MIAALDTDALSLAGAFVIGLTLGILTTIRVMRAVLRTFENRRRSSSSSELEE